MQSPDYLKFYVYFIFMYKYQVGKTMLTSFITVTDFRQLEKGHQYDANNNDT